MVTAEELVLIVSQSEDKCYEYLQSFGLFSAASVRCPGENGQVCGAEMKRVIRNDKKLVSWRCRRNICRTRRSFRATNRFFTNVDKNNHSNCKLSIKTIILFVYFWIECRSTISQMQRITGLSRQSIVVWSKKCRKLCPMVLYTAPKFTGTEEEPIQVDESYFRGRRKYNRGRYGPYDKRNPGEKKAQKEEEELVADVIESKRNHGNRILGPWVVGLYKSAEQVRFKVVPDRKAATLIPLIKLYVTDESVVVTDEWKGYLPLKRNSICHKRVNHSKNFVNPNDGFHTQAIERAWVDAKAEMKRLRSPGKYLQSRLDEVAWRKLRRNHPGGLFAAFWEDVHRMHSRDF